MGDWVFELNATFAALATEAEVAYRRHLDKDGVRAVKELEAEGGVLLARLKRFVDTLEARARSMDRGGGIRNGTE